MNSSSQAATRPGRSSGDGDRAHPIDPGRAAHLGAFLKALVDLQHDAGNGAHAERQEHREIGDQQQPQRAIDRDRENQPGPHHAEREDQSRHRLWEHRRIFDQRRGPAAVTVDEPGQQARSDDADRRGARNASSRLLPIAERTAFIDRAVRKVVEA